MSAPQRTEVAQKTLELHARTKRLGRISVSLCTLSCALLVLVTLLTPIAPLLARLMFLAIGALITTTAMIARQHAATSAQQAALCNEQEALATHDALTGLDNRRSFEDTYEVFGLSSPQTGRSSSILLLDLDHFKLVNDQYGHAVGDKVLIATAQRIRTVLRSTDTVARIGGEEFAVLLPDTSVEDAIQIAEQLCERMRNQPVVYDVTVTSSCGVAETHGEPLEAALRRADVALYAAKDEGRDRVRALEET